MRNYKILITLMIVSALFLAGCGKGGEESTSSKSNAKAQKEGEELNLLNHLSDIGSLLDVDHEHYPYTDVNGFDYETVTYIDENIAISSVNSDTNRGTAINWKTGEAIWDEDIAVFADGHSKKPVVDGWLYYKWKDEKPKKISVDPDSNNNKEEEIDELEYEVFSSEFMFDDRSYVIEQNGDDRTILAYDINSLEKQWEFTPDTYSSLNGYVKEVGDYVLINSDAFEYHVLDKETGEVLFEDSVFYSDGILVDDKIYLVNGVGGGSVSYTFHVLDTNTWELEELVDPARNPYNYDAREYLEYNDGILSFHLDQGVVGADVNEKDPFMNFLHFNEEESIETLGYGYVDTIVHDGKFYILSYHETSDPHALLSIMDIKTGEVLEQYEINEFKLTRPYYEVKVFEKINDDQFIIVSEDDGIYEFNFSSFE